MRPNLPPQEQRVHCPLEPDVKLADLAFGQGYDGNVRKAQVLEQRCDVRLIATDAVERFSQHNIEPVALGVLQERLNARTQDHAGARNGGVMIDSSNLPLLALCLFPAKPKLVVDRASALNVGRIAGVEHNTGHRLVSGSAIPRQP